jgi:ribosomal protein S18 acetylase RimI-like enzyme
MTELRVRQAISSDISEIVAFDHGYSTDHVWQMGFQNGQGEVEVRFREVRLPRPMRVRYPRQPEALIDSWTEKQVVLVAEFGETRTGYLTIIAGPSPGSAWITDLAVDLRHRRQGHASGLLQTARAWAGERGYRRLFLEMQSKNFPAIALARKLGFSFSGYSDHYFPDGDIALFFVQDI